MQILNLFNPLLLFHRISEMFSKDWNSNLNWESSNGWWNLVIGIGFIFLILFALCKLLDQEFSIREKCKKAISARKTNPKSELVKNNNVK